MAETKTAEPAKTEAKVEPTPVQEPPKTEAKTEEPIPELESSATNGKKPNKSEKKCKKALSKLGMKQVAGITRVTLKRKDGCIFSINNPEVLKSGTHDNCFVVFGEMKLDDPNLRMSQKEAKQYTEPAKEEKKVETKKEEKKAEEPKKDEGKKEEAPKTEAPKDDAPLSEEGLDKGNLDLIMNHTHCTRNDAIRALKEASGDLVQAILKATK